MRVDEIGLVIDPERPWMGNSPDGIITIEYQSGYKERGLLEIKCPATKKYYDPPVPSHYMAQIQGTMGNLSLSWCDFVVWIPSTGIQITRVTFDSNYWNNTLLPGLTDFYFNMYMPIALKKENNLLFPNELE